MQNVFRALGLITTIAAEIPGIVADGKITISELLQLAQKIADKLGYDIDTEGFDVPQ